MIRWRKNRIREREKITRSCIYGCLLMEKIYIGSLMIIFVFPSSRFITFDSQIKKNVHSLSSDGSHITAQWKLISRLYGFSRDEFALAMRKGHTLLRWWWWILNAKFHYLAVNDLEMRSWKLGWNQMKVDQVSNEIQKETISPWNISDSQCCLFLCIILGWMYVSLLRGRESGSSSYIISSTTHLLAVLSLALGFFLFRVRRHPQSSPKSFSSLFFFLTYSCTLLF